MAEPKPHTSSLTNECHFTTQPVSSTLRFKMAELGLSIESLPQEVGIHERQTWYGTARRIGGNRTWLGRIMQGRSLACDGVIGSRGLFFDSPFDFGLVSVL